MFITVCSGLVTYVEFCQLKKLAAISTKISHNNVTRGWPVARCGGGTTVAFSLAVCQSLNSFWRLRRTVSSLAVVIFTFPTVGNFAPRDDGDDYDTKDDEAWRDRVNKHPSGIAYN